MCSAPSTRSTSLFPLALHELLVFHPLPGSSFTCCVGFRSKSSEKTKVPRFSSALIGRMAHRVSSSKKRMTSPRISLAVQRYMPELLRLRQYFDFDVFERDL